ncbi:class I SAM-dependent methyltransferase [Nocardiopsis ansamitocini]|uniref:Methyltransferase type 11 domain-containing protein n=1 Tax=Nocardiopsis ansamitocini TaxID=1670832 RepID=A0A9W6P7T6_9ACTN|nr:methyltransferase domain-containing protein [Nocardiopsis ansamitocini]GLU48642.1 hypothetical protein Nans01_29930 [Nocardiopsis ansamitocini]
MLVSARSYDEYRAMFALTDEDLSQRVLDCPGGAADFTAVASARGGDALAVDPQYALGRDLGPLVLREIQYKHADLAATADAHVWTWFGDADRYTRLRLRSARTFSADLATRPERYLAAALPSLPFADRSFDLVLSSHLLFSYGATLDEAFHLAALLELARVARKQVRLFPVVLHTSNRPYPALDRLRQRLHDSTIPTRLEPVGYEFQPGGNQVLILDCTHHDPLPGTTAAIHTPHLIDPTRWRHLETPRSTPS